MLTLYHASPIANSGKVLIAVHEKGLDFVSRYIDLHAFEQHEPWFLRLNPEGQAPVLDHDGVVLTQSSVINEYLEDAFPGTPALRPASPVAIARMRQWNKYIDDHVMNAVSIHGWQHGAGAVARAVEPERFEQLMARVPLKAQRDKWRQARIGFPQTDLDAAEEKVREAVIRVEAQLAEGPWLMGDMFTLADINFFSYCGGALAKMFPHIGNSRICPRLLGWADKMCARPGVAAALATKAPAEAA